MQSTTKIQADFFNKLTADSKTYMEKLKIKEEAKQN